MKFLAFLMPTTLQAAGHDPHGRKIALRVPMTDSLADGERARQVEFGLSTKTIVTLVLLVASLWLLVRLWPGSSRASSPLSSSPAR